MSADALEVRVYRDGDEGAIVESYNLACGADRTLDDWGWRYPPSPAGRPIVLARRGRRVVAHLGGAASQLQLGRQRLSAVRLVDPFVLPHDPEAEPPAGLWARTVDAFVSEFGPGRRFDMVYSLDGGGGELAVEGEVVPAAETVELCRSEAATSPVRRLAYRAEPARDWEPRLDELWRRVRPSYPVAVVRDAECALARHAGNPAVRHHRFLVLPRFGRRALAFAAFAAVGDECRWLDLVWDHGHPGALELLAHVSSRLARQLGATRERLLLGGDPEGHSRLRSLGFDIVGEPWQPRLVVAARTPAADLEALASRLYLAASDLEAW